MEDEILDEGIVFKQAPSAESAKEILKLKTDYADLHQKIKYGRNAIWWMTGLFVLGAIFEGVSFQWEPILMAFNFGIIVSMAATGFVSFKKPFLGFLLAGCVIAILQTLIFIGGNGAEVIRGLLPRIIILYFIIIAMNASKQYIATLKGLKSHGITVEGSELV